MKWFSVKKKQIGLILGPCWPIFQVWANKNFKLETYKLFACEKISWKKKLIFLGPCWPTLSLPLPLDNKGFLEADTKVVTVRPKLTWYQLNKDILQTPLHSTIGYWYDQQTCGKNQKNLIFIFPNQDCLCPFLPVMIKLWSKKNFKYTQIYTTLHYSRCYTFILKARKT